MVQSMSYCDIVINNNKYILGKKYSTITQINLEKGTGLSKRKKNKGHEQKSYKGKKYTYIC